MKLPLSVFLITSALLSVVQLKLDNPMLLLERFLPGGGWAEIALVAFYASVVAYHMQDPGRVKAWRKYTWFAFTLVFFSQLFLGLAGYDRFLMSGKLHLPVPMMILAGPLYRGHLSVMTILFASTVVLSGPAWCSHLCYFGAIDNISSQGRTTREPIRMKRALKGSILILVVAGALILRWAGVPVLTTTLVAGGFGIAGLGIILLLSRKEKRMIHCTAYCPIGTIVNVTRHVNPFRLRIDPHSCTDCMACSRWCKYDALNSDNIRARKPGFTCTLCGDCIASCHAGSLQYSFPGLNAASARNLYLLITITLHASTLALARI